MTSRPRAWERTDDAVGHGVGRLARGDDGWLAHGVEVLADDGGGGGPGACWFRVRLDDGWLTREVDVRCLAGDGERILALRADDDRRWTLDGRPRPDLDGCLDVDVAATPLTNTFPIRRLAGGSGLAALAVGERTTLAVAWVDVPALTVARVEQTYERLGERAWRYRDDTHGAFDLTVDADGVVVDYEGLARRVGGSDGG
ncbi:putative glycolipid-binding domain-containing protein [Nocardioides marinquilinus]|uniref:Glycolipid-binding domain-containing protein n=1 Tax=Nocardioides marinquilinus TaxID=1210400 RepID=A0ABP9PWF4_9ACTN